MKNMYTNEFARFVWIDLVIMDTVCSCTKTMVAI